MAEPGWADSVMALVEAKIEHTVRGIEETLRQVLERRGMSREELVAALERLQEGFSLLSQRWVLPVMIVLLLGGEQRFSSLKRTLGIGSRVLTDKLRALERAGLVVRRVEPGSPVSTWYSLTPRGREMALLAIPLLYRAAATSTPPEDG